MDYVELPEYHEDYVIGIFDKFMELIPQISDIDIKYYNWNDNNYNRDLLLLASKNLPNIEIFKFTTGLSIYSPEIILIKFNRLKVLNINPCLNILPGNNWENFIT